MIPTKLINLKMSVNYCLKRFNNYVRRAELDEKKHQLDGMKWCLKNELREDAPNGVKGGLVADEMGLGKTIQMMGLIVSNVQRHTLIILPLALLDQWKNEILRTMHIHALIYHGTNKKIITHEMLSNAPIVITTYGQISALKGEKHVSALHEHEWDRVIFDEAHHLRNKNTRAHQGALALKSKIRWLVTGTPIQNRKADFYALCAAMGLSSEYYTETANLHELVRNFVMKRTKKEVGIKLPALKNNTVDVEWTNEGEYRLAEDIHSMLLFSNVAHSNDRRVNNAIALMGSGAFCTLPLLVRARQACIYPHLIKEQIQEYIKMGLLEDDEELLNGTDHSSKIDAVVDKIVERKSNKRNKLIFCHYRGEIDILESRLKKADMSVNTFDGRTGHAERNTILSSNVDALILQIQTGCEGLNLQQFSEIYFVSPHWNPAIEDQAVARCHRIGQKNPVNVFRFKMKPFDEEDETQTLDKYCAAIQEAKRELIETFLEENEV